MHASKIEQPSSNLPYTFEKGVCSPIIRSAFNLVCQKICIESRTKVISNPVAEILTVELRLKQSIPIMAHKLLVFNTEWFVENTFQLRLCIHSIRKPKTFQGYLSARIRLKVHCLHCCKIFLLILFHFINHFFTSLRTVALSVRKDSSDSEAIKKWCKNCRTYFFELNGLKRTLSF